MSLFWPNSGVHLIYILFLKLLNILGNRVENYVLYVSEEVMK